MKLFNLLVCIALLALTAAAQTATRTLCLFFDLGSIGAEEQVRAEEAAVQFVQKNITPDERVAIVIYTDAIHTVQALTSDKDTLVNAIRALPRFDRQSEVDEKLRALREVASVLAILPGKKQVIYFTGGLARNLDHQAELDNTVLALRVANVSLYPMDARGLTAAR